MEIGLDRPKLIKPFSVPSCHRHKVRCTPSNPLATLLNTSIDLPYQLDPCLLSPRRRVTRHCALRHHIWGLVVQPSPVTSSSQQPPPRARRVNGLWCNTTSGAPRLSCECSRAYKTGWCTSCSVLCFALLCRPSCRALLGSVWPAITMYAVSCSPSFPKVGLKKSRWEGGEGAPV